MLRTPTLQTTVMVPCHASCFFFASIYRPTDVVKTWKFCWGSHQSGHDSTGDHGDHGTATEHSDEHSGDHTAASGGTHDDTAASHGDHADAGDAHHGDDHAQTHEDSGSCPSPQAVFADHNLDIFSMFCSLSMQKSDAIHVPVVFQNKSRVWTRLYNFSDSPFEGRLLVHCVSLGRTLMATTEGFLAKVLVRILRQIYIRIVYTY